MKMKKKTKNKIQTKSTDTKPTKKQIEKFKPKYIVISEKLLQHPKGTIKLKEDEVEKMFEKCDLFVNGISGLAGLKYTITALKKRTKDLLKRFQR